MFLRPLILVVCFSAGAVLVARSERPEPVPVRPSFASFPMQLGAWRGVQEPPLDKNVLDILQVDDYLTRAYFTPAHAGAGLYVGYWGSQRQGDTMHSPLNCLPGSGWEPLSHTMMPITVANDGSSAESRTITVNRYMIQKGIDRMLVLYWYQSHGRVVASEYWGKFYLIHDAMQMNRTDGALVRITVPIAGDGDSAHAEEQAVSFVKVLFPVLEGYLPS
jgi:EpsI family protein